jgi:hypothetical protein
MSRTTYPFLINIVTTLLSCWPVDELGATYWNLLWSGKAHLNSQGGQL